MDPGSLLAPPDTGPAESDVSASPLAAACDGRVLPAEAVIHAGGRTASAA
jgi:hypothetical protein